jgi:hypothetical protein
VGWWGEPGNGVDERCFARPVGADKSNNRSLLDLQVDVVVGIQATIGNGDSVAIEECHLLCLLNVQ